MPAMKRKRALPSSSEQPFQTIADLSLLTPENPKPTESTRQEHRARTRRFIVLGHLVEHHLDITIAEWIMERLNIDQAREHDRVSLRAIEQGIRQQFPTKNDGTQWPTIDEKSDMIPLPLGEKKTDRSLL